MLALLNPQGKTLWRREKQTLWGLCFANEYKKPNPLDPQMLFAGQYFDEESGLAYNRFRYYDPESACYISSDPIGLQGGETPYAYVFNPTDWLDPWGLTKTPTYVLKKLWKNETGISPSGYIHHGLPEQLSDKFKKLANLDVNNPKYFYDLTPNRHIKKPNGIHTNTSPLGQEWNKHWDNWLRKNENRLQKIGKERAGKVIEKHLDKIAKKSGINDYNSSIIKKCGG